MRPKRSHPFAVLPLLALGVGAEAAVGAGVLDDVEVAVFADGEAEGVGEFRAVVELAGGLEELPEAFAAAVMELIKA